MKSRQIKIFTFISLIVITLLLLGGVTAFDTNNNQTTADNTMITSTTDNSYTGNGISNENLKTSTKEIQQTTQADTNDDISGAEEQNKDKAIKKDIETTTKTSLKGADSPTYNITVRDNATLEKNGTNYYNTRWLYQGTGTTPLAVFQNNSVYWVGNIKNDYNATYFNYPISKQSDTIIDCMFWTTSSKNSVEWGLMGLLNVTPYGEGKEGYRPMGREFVYNHEVPSWEYGVPKENKYIQGNAIKITRNKWTQVQFHINYGTISVTYNNKTYGPYTLLDNNNTELYLFHRSWGDNNWTKMSNVTITTTMNKEVIEPEFSTYVDGASFADVYVNQEVELVTVLYDEDHNIITKGTVQYFLDEDTPLADAVTIDPDTGKAVLPFTFDEAGDVDLIIKYHDEFNEYYAADLSKTITVLEDSVEAKTIDSHEFDTQINDVPVHDIYVNQEVDLVSQFFDEYENPVTKGTVQYFIGNNQIGDAVSIDSESESAILKHRFTTAGDVTLTVIYTDATHEYNSYQFTEIITIKKMPVTLSIDDVSATVGKSTDIKARVSHDTLSITSGSVEFFVDDESIGTSNIGADSTATITYTFPEAKEYTIKAVYTDNNYIANDATKTVSVDNKHAVITVAENFNGYVNQQVDIPVTVFDDDVAITHGTLTLKDSQNNILDTQEIFEDTTTLRCTFDKADTYELTVTYTDDEYAADDAALTVVIEKLLVSLSIDNIEPYATEDIEIVASVDHDGIGITSGSVEFFVNDESIGSSNVGDDSTARITYTFPESEVYIIRAVYSSDNYIAYNAYRTVQVKKIDITMSADDQTGYIDKDVVIPVNLFNGDEKIQQGSIELYVDDEWYGFVNLDYGDSPELICQFDSEGTHTLRIEYIDSAYQAEDIYVTVTITKKPVTLTLYNTSCLVNDPATINIQVSVDEGDNAEGTVTFYEGDTLLGEAQVYWDGTGYILATFDTIGEHNIKAVYQSDKLIADDAFGIVTVEKQPPKAVDIDCTIFVNGQSTYASEIGDEVDFRCYIMSDYFENIVKKGTVQYFYKNGTPLSGVIPIDEETGISSFLHTFNMPGGYPIIIKYVDESEEYASAEYEFIHSVNYLTANIDISDIKAKLGRTVNLTAFVYTDNGDSVGEDCFVIFNINDNENTTSEPIQVIDGRAVFAYTIKEGANKVKVSSGTPIYEISTASAKITISEGVAEIHFYDDQLEGYVDENIYVRVAIQTDGDPVEQGTLILTDENGNNLTEVFNIDRNNRVLRVNIPFNTSGTHKVVAKYDDVYYTAPDASINVIINKYDATLTLDDASGFVNRTTSITANVKYDNNALNQGKVSFYEDDTLLGTVDVVDGKAVLDYKFMTDGNHNIKAVYDDRVYQTENQTKTVTINKNPATISVQTPITGYVDEPTSIIITILDGQTPIEHGTITLQDENDQTIATQTITTGTTTINYNFPEENTYNIKVNYDDVEYVAEQTPITVTINKIPVTLTIDDVEAFVDKDATITARVELDDTTISQGSVEFFVDDTSIGTANIADSIATITYKFPAATDYTVKAVYADVKYTAEDATKVVTVSKNPATIIVTSPVSGFVDENTEFTVSVESDGETITQGTITLVDGGNVLNTTVITQEESTIGYTFPQEDTYTYKLFYSDDKYTADDVEVVFNIVKASVSIVADDQTGFVGEDVTIPVSVVKGEDTIQQGTVYLVDENDEVLDSVVLSDADAEVKVVFDSEGTYSLKLRYDDFKYTADDKSITVTISKVDVILSIDDVEAFVDKDATITARVELDDTVISQGSVEFFVDDISIGTSSVTDSIATITYKFPAATQYTVKAVYTDIKYTAEDATKVVTVSKNPATIIVTTPVSGFVDENTEFTVSIESEGQTVTQGTITLVDNDNVLNTTVISQETSTMGYTFPQEDTYAYKLSYSDDKYVADDVEVVFNIVKADVSIVADNQTGFVGEDVTIPVSVIKGEDSIRQGTVYLVDENDSVIDSVVLSDVDAEVKAVFGAEGTYNLKLRYDNFKYTADDKPITITISKIPVVLSLDDVEAFVDKDATITAHVDLEGTVISQGSVEFFVDDISIGTSNVVDSTATITYKFPAATQYTVKAVYSDVKYTAEDATTTVDVAKNPATIIVTTPVSGFVDENTEFTVSIESEGQTVTQGTVTLVDNDNVLNTTVISQEENVVGYTFPQEDTYAYKLSYSDDKYVADDVEVVFNIVKADVSIVADDQTGFVGEDVVIPVSVIKGEDSIQQGTVYLVGENDSVIDSVVLSDVDAELKAVFDSEGTYSLKLRYDDFKYTADDKPITVTISKVEVTLSLDDVEAFVDKDATITARVELDDTVISQGSVEFFVDDISIGTSSVTDSIATITYKFPAATQYNVKAVYTDVKYTAEDATTTVDVAKNPATIIVTTPINGFVDENTEVTVSVESEGQTIAQGTITLVDGDNVLNTTVITQEESTIGYTFPQEDTYTYKLSYGDDKYVADDVEVVFNIVKADVSIVADDQVGFVGEDVTIPVSVIKGEDSIRQGTVYLVGENDSVIDSVVLSDVDAEVKAVFGAEGTYTLKLRYDNFKYTADDKPITITINKIPVTLSIDDITAFVDKDATITARVELDGTVISQGSVEFFVDDISIGISNVVDSTAIITYKFPAATQYTVKAVYSDVKYTAEDATKTVVVTKSPVVINVAEQITGYVDDDTVITVTITENEQIISQGRLSVIYDDEDLDTKVVQDDETALVVVFNQEGQYTVTIKYDDNKYTAEDAQVQVTINKIPVTLSIDDTVGFVDKQTPITAHITVNDTVVTDGEVSFYYDDQLIEKVQVGSDGTATTSYIFNQADTYNVKAVYSSYRYTAEDTDKDIVIIKNPAQIQVEVPITGYVEEQTLITIRVVEDDNPITQGMLTLKGAEGTILNTTTVTSEETVIGYTFNSEGTYLVSIDYDDYKYTADSQENIPVEIGYNPIEITLDDAEGIIAKDVTIKATITSSQEVPSVGSLTFKYADGRVIEENVEIIDGQASIIMNFDKADTYEITAVYNGPVKYKTESTENAIVTINKIPSVITADNITAIVGKPVTITTTITTDDYTINEGYLIIKDSQDNIIDRQAVVDGQITTTITLDTVDNYTFTVEYESADNFIADSTTFNVNVYSIDTNMVIEAPETLKVGQTTTLEVQILSVDDSTINQGIVTFTDKNGNHISDDYEVEVVDGIVTIDYTPTKVGTNKIIATFTSNDTYTSSNTTIIIKTVKAATTLTIDPVYAYVGDKITLTAHVNSEIEDDVINEGQVAFKINGKTLKDANGKVIYAKVVNGIAVVEDYEIPDSWITKETTISAVYSGSSNYNSSKDSTTDISVLTGEVSFEITSNDTFTKDAVKTFTATVKDGNVLVNKGQVIFKINGKTLKDADGKVIYVDVVDGIASVDFNVNSTYYKTSSWTLKAVLVTSDYDRVDATQVLRLAD